MTFFRNVLIFCLLTLSISFVSAESINSDVSFTTISQKVVVSDGMLVRIEFNATSLTDDESLIKNSVIQKVTSILNSAKLDLIYSEYSNNTSGSKNLRLVFQSRLTSSQLIALKKGLKNYNSSSSSFDIQVISHNPSMELLQHMKQEMIIEIYQSIQQYVARLNSATSSSYKIKSISYKVMNSRVKDFIKLHQNTMDRTKAFEKLKQKHISPRVLKIKTYVVLIQPLHSEENLNNEQLAVKVGQEDSQVTTPKYLRVKGFKKCLNTKNNGTFKSLCMPFKQPKNCLDASWKSLQKLQQENGQKLISC